MYKTAYFQGGDCFCLGQLLSDESWRIRQIIFKDVLVYYCSVAPPLNEEPSLVLGHHYLHVQVLKDSVVLCAYNCTSDLDEVNHKKFSRVTLSYVHGILMNLFLTLDLQPISWDTPDNASRPRWLVPTIELIK